MKLRLDALSTVLRAGVTVGLLVAMSSIAAAGAELQLRDERGVTRKLFPTLREAVIAAGRARSSEPKIEIEILLDNANESLKEPIVIGPELSGSISKATRIAAIAGALPKIQGSQPIALRWKRTKGALWVAPIPDGVDFDQVWVQGKRQVLARYPNYDARISPLNGFAEDALATGRSAKWSHPEDGTVRAIHKFRWGGVLFKIQDRAPDGRLILGPGIANNRVSPPMNEPHDRFRYVEGLVEELDVPGEWFFDRRSKDLFLIPVAGVDLNRATVEVSSTRSLLRIVGSRATPVHDIEIEGLAFSRAIDTLPEANEPLLRSDWKIARTGAVFIEGAARVSVVRNRFTDLSAQGVFVSGYARQVRIEGNEFVDIGGTAISFVGLPSAVRSPAFEYAESVALKDIDRTPGPLTEDYPAESVATDNLIHSIGFSDKQAAGINLSMAMSITLSYNSIYHVPRAGINICDGTWGGHVLEHNDVFDTVLESGDHGAFNSWGRDRFWRAEREAMNASVAAEPSLPYLDAIKPIVIRNNRFQSDHGWDIDLDDGSSNYQIYNNLMLTGGLKLREGFGRRVFNNILVNNSFHPHVWFKNSGDTFERNIVMAPYQPILMEHWSQPIDNNLFPTTDALQESNRLGLDAHSIVGEPDFADAGHGDFRVKATSSALKVGFVNFPMRFGVRSPTLLARSKQPPIPQLLSAVAVKRNYSTNVLGATVKSVETLGEQSAAGLAEISGVLVLSVEPGSAADRSGLKKGDVIEAVVNTAGETRLGADMPIRALPDLLLVVQARRWQGGFKFKIRRNQQQQTIELRI